MSEPLRALVLEDEWPARNYLVQLLERSGLAHVVAAVPNTTLASEALATSALGVDVVFVDVHLSGERAPARAGLSWIESAVAGLPSRPRIVLTTAKSEHAMRAFELGVIDYLLKPFTAARVKATLERVIGFAQKHHAETSGLDPRIVARQGRSIVFLRRDEAYAFEAEGRMCYVHSTRGKLDIDLSLTSLEAVLGPGYLRVHRAWLVSLSHVRSIEREDGEAVLCVGPVDPPLRIAIARDRAVAVQKRLLASAVGLRKDV